MSRIYSIFSGLCLALLLVGAVGAQGGTMVKLAHNDEYGNIATDSRGMTLYMFKPDKANMSVCYGECATAWPPLIAKGGNPMAAKGLSGTLSTTARKDGSKQVTMNGMPLYYFFKDKKPGDANGQGAKDVWFVLNASGMPVTEETTVPHTGAGGLARDTSIPTLGLGILAALACVGLGFAYRARRYGR